MSPPVCLIIDSLPFAVGDRAPFCFSRLVPSPTPLDIVTLCSPHSTIFTRVADLITDHPRQPLLRLRIGCRIEE